MLESAKLDPNAHISAGCSYYRCKANLSAENLSVERDISSPPTQAPHYTTRKEEHQQGKLLCTRPHAGCWQSWEAEAMSPDSQHSAPLSQNCLPGSQEGL